MYLYLFSLTSKKTSCAVKQQDQDHTAKHVTEQGLEPRYLDTCKETQVKHAFLLVFPSSLATGEMNLIRFK